MARRTNHANNPFAIWTKLALEASEMMMASAQVIGHRTQRLAQSSTPPSARDQREFALMGQEKVAAIAESTQAVALRMMTMNPWLAPNALRHMANATSAMMSLSASRSVGELMARQAKLADAMIRSAGSATHLLTSTGELASQGIKPLHSRVTANAKRLAKKA